MARVLKTAIVGTRFRGDEAIQTLGSLQKGAQLTLKREPHNRYDPNAVAVYFGDVHLGYVPKDRNSPLAKALDEEPGLRLAVDLIEKAVMDGGVIKFAPKILIRERRTLEDMVIAAELVGRK